MAPPEAPWPGRRGAKGEPGSSPAQPSPWLIAGEPSGRAWHLASPSIAGTERGASTPSEANGRGERAFTLPSPGDTRRASKLTPNSWGHLQQPQEEGFQSALGRGAQTWGQHPSGSGYLHSPHQTHEEQGPPGTGGVELNRQRLVKSQELGKQVGAWQLGLRGC